MYCWDEPSYGRLLYRALKEEYFLVFESLCETCCWKVYFEVSLMTCCNPLLKLNNKKTVHLLLFCPFIRLCIATLTKAFRINPIGGPGWQGCRVANFYIQIYNMWWENGAETWEIVFPSTWMFYITIRINMSGGVRPPRFCNKETFAGF